VASHSSNSAFSLFFHSRTSEFRYRAGSDLVFSEKPFPFLVTKWMSAPTIDTTKELYKIP